MPGPCPEAAASRKHAEVMLIETALCSHHGNLSKVALSLGISRLPR